MGICKSLFLAKLQPKPRYMRQISLWSKHHRWTARFLIVLLQFVLVAIGLLLGDLLALTGVILPGIVVYASYFIFLLCAACYPSKKNKAAYNNFYRFQKSIDLALVATSFVIITGLGNGTNSTPRSPQSSFAVSSAAASVDVPPRLGTGKHNPVKGRYTSKKGLKGFKQQLKERVKTIRQQYKDASRVEKNLLIILAVLISLLLLLLVASLSCSLSCAGSTGGAVLVGVFGTGLIVFLLVKAITRINRGKPSPKRSEPAEQTIQDSRPSV